jgi:hypothetical protein
MNTSYHTYPKVYSLGHAGVKELLFDEVIVEEKLDGSQFSFGRFGGELKVRSKGAHMDLDRPEAMFAEGVAVVKSLDLRDGWTYRAEYLKTPKHNTIAYSRVPKGHLMIFDINTAEEEYLPYLEKYEEAKRIGLEVIPRLFAGRIHNPADVVSLLEKESILGGAKVEGIVIKNYKRFGMDKKVLMAKYVSEDFKEVHKGDWTDRNPQLGDIVQRLIVAHKTPARWDKAIQHLRDAGKLTDSPKDIGMVIKAVQDDIADEEREAIKNALWAHVSSDFNRGVVRGIPEYYKEYLMKKQFVEP